MSLSQLPHLNAALNLCATVLLILGYRAIRAGLRERHRRLMLSATVVSAAFLTSYLIYHVNAGSVPFTGSGVVRIFYFVVLISHIVLAAVAGPLVIVTLSRALRGEFDRHRRLARWTWPIWLYVSITGVVIYVMLYWLYATAPA